MKQVNIFARIIDFLRLRCYTNNTERGDSMANVFDVAKYILEKERNGYSQSIIQVN